MTIRFSFLQTDFNIVAPSSGKMGKRLNVKVYEPEPILCTDNAAMIASNGYYKFIKNEFADLKLNAIPNLKLRTIVSNLNGKFWKPKIYEKYTSLEWRE